MADEQLTLSTISAMMDEVFDLRPIPIEAVFGQTVQHVKRKELWTSDKHHFKAYDHGHARTTVQGASNLESAVPDAGTPAGLDIYVDRNDFNRLDATVQVSIPADYIMTDDHCMLTAREQMLDVEMDFGKRRNELVHGIAAGSIKKGTVAAKYSYTGGSYSQAKTAMIQITDASVSLYDRGEYLSVYDSGDTIRCVVRVMGIVHQATWRGNAVGPGLIIALADGTNNTGDEDAGIGDLSHLDTLVATDYLLRHDDDTSASMPCSFANLCPTVFTSALAYFSVTDRRALRYDFLCGNYRDYVSSGSPVDFDVETHLGNMADDMAYILGPARGHRAGRGVEFSKALVVVAQPEICRYAINQEGNPYKRLMLEKFSSLSAAKQKELVAVSGWNGLVIHLGVEHIPPIVLQSEPMARKNTVTVFDPSAYMWIRMGETSGKPQWLIEGGSRWALQRDSSTAKRKPIHEASCMAFETMFNENPQSSTHDILNVQKG